MDDRLGHFDHWLGPHGSESGIFGPVAEITKTLGSTTVVDYAAVSDPFLTRTSRRRQIHSKTTELSNKDVLVRKGSCEVTSCGDIAISVWTIFR